MPYKTTWEEKGVYWQYFEIVSPDDISNSNDEFYNDPRSDSVSYQIADFSNVCNNELDEFSVEKVAVMDYAASLYIKNIKVAFVLSSCALLGSIKLYIKLSIKTHGNWSIQIFQDMDSARKWVSQS